MRLLARALLYAWMLTVEVYLAVSFLAVYLARGGTLALLGGAFFSWCLADDWRDAWAGEPFWPFARSSWKRMRER